MGLGIVKTAGVGSSVGVGLGVRVGGGVGVGTKVAVGLDKGLCGAVSVGAGVGVAVGIGPADVTGGGVGESNAGIGVIVGAVSGALQANSAINAHGITSKRIIMATFYQGFA